MNTIKYNSMYKITKAFLTCLSCSLLKLTWCILRMWTDLCSCGRPPHSQAYRYSYRSRACYHTAPPHHTGGSPHYTHLHPHSSPRHLHANQTHNHMSSCRCCCNRWLSPDSCLDCYYYTHQGLFIREIIKIMVMHILWHLFLSGLKKDAVLYFNYKFIDICHKLYLYIYM